MAKPNILALHGFTGCGEDFTRFSPFCRTVNRWDLPDLPGHGRSAGLACHPEAMIDFVDRRARTLPAPRVLLGYSMGARAALLHALGHPRMWDALILISANPGIESDAERRARRVSDAQLAQRIRANGIRDFLDDWEQQPVIRSQSRIRAEWRAAMRASREKNTTDGLAASLRDFGQSACPDLWPELPRLTGPVLLVSGAEDLKYTAIAEKMAAQLPAAVHCPISGCGHMPHLEAPEDTAGAVDRFLTRLKT